MFNLKTSETNSLFEKLKEIKISQQDFLIPQDSSISITALHKIENFKIKHLQYPKYYFQIEYVISQFRDKIYFECSYCPGGSEFIERLENSITFPSILRYIPFWYSSLQKELLAENEKENILKELHSNISDSSLTLDEPFSVNELTDVLPKALNDFKAKILSSNIPAEAKQKIIQGTDEYYEKAKKGNVNKQVWFGGFLLFIATTLAEYGLEKFYDSIFEYVKSSFHIFPVLAM